MDKALSQMGDMCYIKELKEDGYEMVYCYGIASCGKDCLVRLANDI